MESVTVPQEIIAAIPLFEGRDLDISPLQGVQSLNNSAWTVVAGSERYLLRIANPDAVTYLGVRRDEEAAAARAAAAAGIAPEVLYYDETLGHMVTPWIESGPQWEASDFRDPAQIGRLVDLVRRMHAVSEVPGDAASVFRRVERLLDSARDLGLETPPQLDEYRRRLADIEAERRADPRWLPGLNHNDLWANNMLDDGTRLWLIDWEFAGRGDGLYDLATISMAGEYGTADDVRLLGEYGLQSTDVAALDSMKWVVHFFEAAWSLVMYGRTSGTPVEPGGFDYLGHAQRMFAGLAEKA